ncbi:MAG: sigma-70 family RNA polymerase sigma factor [Candidatus Riflebacteria bacterium]|nr:sigma-70 family RNA polymerase sigma factor [Candidatus Riflebacteria bacterium]
MKVIKEDSELVACAKSGNKRCFELLFDKHLPGVLGFFYYLRAPEDVIDDLIQETFTKAFCKLSLYDSEKSFTNWLLSLARNLYYDHCRKKLRDRNLVESVSHNTQKNLEEKAMDNPVVEDLLDSLPEEARFLIELRVFQELSFNEIASILKEPEVNIRVRFHRIVSRLRDASGKEGNHD